MLFLALFVALRPVQDIRLGRVELIELHQVALHDILHLFDGRNAFGRLRIAHMLQIVHHIFYHRRNEAFIRFTHRVARRFDSMLDTRAIEIRDLPVPLLDFRDFLLHRVCKTRPCLAA